MSGFVKKEIINIVLVTCILLASACSKDNQPPVAAPEQKRVHVLAYSAGPNGAIDGPTTQKVKDGESGSPVTAVPNEHYHFSGWSDGLDTASRTDAKVRGNLEVTARFAIDQHALDYAAAEGGSIDGPATQMVDHGGSGVPVTAVAGSGYRFAGWSDSETNNPRNDTQVTQDLKVVANFVPDQYSLTYVAGKNGRLEGNSRQLAAFGGRGTTVTAVPAEHYHFVGWSDGKAKASRTDGEIKNNLEVTAQFAIDQYSLSYLAEENGSIQGLASQQVPHGGSGQPVLAIPAPGYHFTGWSDGLSQARRTDADVRADLKATASFAINRYTLTYTSGANGTIQGVNSQSVDHGRDGQPVTAVPEKGYHFVLWSDGNTSAGRTDKNLSGDLKVSAKFEVNTYTVGGRVKGLVQGTSLVLQNNDGDDLTLTSDGDFSFASELIDGANYAVAVLNQPTSPNQTCSVTAGAGIIDAGDVNNVKVSCVINTYTIGGTVSGFPEGDQVVLLNNQIDQLALSAQGTFIFEIPLDDGTPYLVEVAEPPKKDNWICALENAGGTLSGADVTDVLVDCYPQVVLGASAGIRKVKLDWNSQDFSQVTFNLCRAQEEIPADGFSRCQDLKDGTMVANLTNPSTITQLTNDISYWFQLEASYANGRRTFSKVVRAIPFGGLNDTGIDWCADESANRFSDGTKTEKSRSCEALAKSLPGQDARYGRDAAALVRKLSKVGSGNAGFDFTKLCLSGAAAGEGKCPPNPLPGTGRNNWACTRDNVTGLTWEVKSDSGLRGKDNTYTWFNANDKVNGGSPGVKNGGKCEGSDCDTQSFVEAVNAQGLCGDKDWRLPTKRELLSIVDNGRFKPAVDGGFFPNTLSSYYWSSSTYPDQKNSAWQVYFLYGEAGPNGKDQKTSVRLVRGRTATFGLNNP